GLAIRAIAGRGGQERVLRRQPPPAAPIEPPRHPVLDRRRAEHLRQALREDDGAVRLLEEVDLEVERPELVGAAAVSAAHATVSSVSVTCSTSRIGSWRNRLPIARKLAGSPAV